MFFCGEKESDQTKRAPSTRLESALAEGLGAALRYTLQKGMFNDAIFERQTPLRKRFLHQGRQAKTARD